MAGFNCPLTARFFGISRTTIRKILTYSEPPGYRRKEPVARPILGPYVGVIDHILESDRAMPKKQRHTARRIFERLRDEHGYPGKYGAVKEYVRDCRQVSREMFIPLHHPPGHGQADFGEALAVIGGV
ncbi:MAG: IS21 family transposase, partial [Nitrospinota bacterium]|nr:IS21 family transposase [Nitrospinota bacterium]